MDINNTLLLIEYEQPILDSHIHTGKVIMSGFNTNKINIGDRIQFISEDFIQLIHDNKDCVLIYLNDIEIIGRVLKK